MAKKRTTLYQKAKARKAAYKAKIKKARIAYGMSK